LTLPTPIRATYHTPESIRCICFKRDALLPSLGEFKAAVEIHFGSKKPHFRCGTVKIEGITISLLLIKLKKKAVPPNFIHVGGSVFNRCQYKDLASFNQQVFIKKFPYFFFFLLLYPPIYIYIYTIVCYF
jgi:hypothetical protein